MFSSCQPVSTLVPFSLPSPYGHTSTQLPSLNSLHHWWPGECYWEFRGWPGDSGG